MKIHKILGIATGALGLALAGSAANAITINGTEVGSVDSFLCAGDLGNSSEADEEAFIESLDCANTDVTYFKAADLSEYVQGTGADAGLNYIDVDPNTPGFFLLKYGANPGDNNVFVFTNLADLMFLVWNDLDILNNGGGTNANGGLLGLSHYAYTGNTSTTTTTTTTTSGDVPEPGTLTLMGLGLLGLGFSRRFRKKTA